MKVICKHKFIPGVFSKRDKYTYLTIGKSYETMDKNGSLIKIVDDSGVFNWYYMENFITLDDIREEKLNLLLG